MKGIVLYKDTLDVVYKKLGIIQKELHKSNAEMAAILGVSKDTYLSYKKGIRKVPLEVLFLLVEEYGVNPEFIISKDGLAPVLRETEKPIDMYFAQIDELERELVVNNSYCEFNHKKMLIRRLIHFILVMIDDL